MKTLTRPAAWAAVAAAALLAGVGPAQDGQPPKPPEPPKKPTVMQRKLGHAQKVLEALALNDFDRIRTESDNLQQCAKEASWQVVKTQKYELYSNDFVRNLDNLKAAALKKNIDSAALAYVELTLTCVKCHQYIRDQGIGANAPELAPRALAGQ